jgi:triosephosphate isomerase
MGRAIAIRRPIFELGLKGYLYGKEALELSRAAQRIAREQQLTMILTPQLIDVALIANGMDGLLVFAPHLDPVPVGRGTGSVLAEAVKAAGASGVFLNHSERPVSLSHLSRAISRAKEVGLLSIVAVDSPTEAAAVACLGPDMIMAEPAKLIGGSKAVSSVAPDFISQAVSAVKKLNPCILVLSGAGIRAPEDAASVIRAGADGTGSTSGVLSAENPAQMLEEMVVAVKHAWVQMHPDGAEPSQQYQTAAHETRTL